MRETTGGAGERILGVDGHEDTCLLIKCLLGPFGYEVTTVNDMTSGLDIAHTADFNLYLIAYKLIEGTGIELCQKLREFDRQTPILFWSALVYEADRQRAFDAGANVFLRKPCDFDLIPRMVSQLVAHSKAPKLAGLSTVAYWKSNRLSFVSPIGCDGLSGALRE